MDEGTIDRKKEQQRKWREAHRDELNAKQRQYYRNNREARDNYHRQWAKGNERNSVNRMLASARSRAKKKEIPFSITREDIVIPPTCPYLGIPLFRGEGKSNHCPNSPSLDRIVPSLGYVPGNVQVISQRANAMKQDASPEELRAFAEAILRG